MYNLFKKNGLDNVTKILLKLYIEYLELNILFEILLNIFIISKLTFFYVIQKYIPTNGNENLIYSFLVFASWMIFYKKEF